MEDAANQQNESPEEQVGELKINEEKLERYIQQRELQQNLPMGIAAGFVACIVGGLLWAAITVATQYQIGYMAIAVGFLVGFAVRIAGKGITVIFGIAGALLALLGCLIGNYLSVVGFAANAEGMGYFEMLSSIDLGLIPEIIMETAQPMDLLFYGFALYAGYNFSFAHITEEDLVNNAVDG